MIRSLGSTTMWDRLSPNVKEKVQNNFLTAAVEFLKDAPSTHADGVDNILTPGIIDVRTCLHFHTTSCIR